MKISYVDGDIIKMIESGFIDSVAHGCNCFHTMGAGIALTLNQYTGGRILEADKKSEFGNINKLGSFTQTRHDDVRYYNLYTQYTYGGYDGVKVHWPSVANSLQKAINEACLDHGCKNMAIPYIGCGLAGGSVDDFMKHLRLTSCYKWDDECLNDFELIVVNYVP